jgi:hypothetical protein
MHKQITTLTESISVASSIQTDASENVAGLDTRTQIMSS